MPARHAASLIPAIDNQIDHAVFKTADVEAIKDMHNQQLTVLVDHCLAVVSSALSIGPDIASTNVLNLRAPELKSSPTGV